MTKLNLSNANLQATEGTGLGEALKENSTLTFLNLDSCFLDATGLMAIADGLSKNRTLETLKVSGLKNFSAGPGAMAEEAFAKALNENTTLTRFGIQLQNPHWRDTIDRRITMNADRKRRLRQLQRVTAPAAFLRAALPPAAAEAHASGTRTPPG